MTRWIYISPHFDDAVLSCGGLIWEQTRKGNPVEIWTICAGDAPAGELSPLAVRCHEQWGIESARELVAARRLENQAAAEMIGAAAVDFSIPDCIYRRDSAGELLYPEEVFVPIHPGDRDLDADIAAALASELLEEDIVVSPLGVGGHPDHVLARRAAEILALPLKFYADIPYTLTRPEQLTEAACGMKETHKRVTRRGMRAWQSAIACYATQMKMLFETEENMRTAVEGYWQCERGIRLWR